MLTRKEYMKNSGNSHKEYWGQFVNDRVIDSVVSSLSDSQLSILRDEYNSGNVHMTGVPGVPLKVWDRMSYLLQNWAVDVNKLKQAGESKAPYVWVCIAKCALRMYFDNE